MAELVDAADLKSADYYNLKGSSPFIPIENHPTRNIQQGCIWEPVAFKKAFACRKHRIDYRTKTGAPAFGENPVKHQKTGGSWKEDYTGTQDQQIEAFRQRMACFQIVPKEFEVPNGTETSNEQQPTEGIATTRHPGGLTGLPTDAAYGHEFIYLLSDSRRRD